MIRNLAAVAATGTLLVTVLPATQAAATTSSPTNCTKYVLALPADSLPGSSRVLTADPSGRYILGEANRDGRMQGQAVLWVNDVPRWLASQPEGESFAYSVTADGSVLGATYSLTRTDFWIYSIATDSYKILQLPEGLQNSLLTGMNNNHDILGVAWDDMTGVGVPYVWRPGSEPQLLKVPAGLSVDAMDHISDEGAVIGRLKLSDGNTTSYLWKSATAEPVRLPGKHQDTVWARDIEGTSIGGQEGFAEDTAGLIWNTRNSRVRQLARGVIDLNTDRDAATEGLWGPIGNYPSMIIRSDGTKITFPDGTQLQHIFERNTRWAAGGYDVSSGTLEPTLYSCR
ncbi:MAG TPA: hypothetical protein VGL05_05935 [Kribbella sp.]